MRPILPVILLVLALLPPLQALAQEGEEDALSADALDKLVRVQGETLNFDDVIRTSRDDARRLDSYDLRWVNANRVGGQESFPVVKEQYQNTFGIQKENLPWSSGYWPFVYCSLATYRTGPHSLSPLEKYDSYVLTKTGSNPRAAAWELNPANQHNYYSKAFEKPTSIEEERKPVEKKIKVQGANGPTEIGGKARYGWFGHCNGWAAAACLVPQPPEQVEVRFDKPLKTASLKANSYAQAYDVSSDGEDQYVVTETRAKTLVFSRADLKGLLTESFMDCIADMSHPIIRQRYLERAGVRDRGFVYKGIAVKDEKDQEYVRQTGGEPFRDVHPHNFHRICLDYLGQRNQPFVTEVDADNPKDNHPTYGYRYTQNFDARRRQYTFTAVVTYATYADATHDGPKPLEVNYTFTMKLDERNRVVSSEWTGASEFNHPDFVWVPVRNAPPGDYENKNLDFAKVQEILKAGGIDPDERPSTEGVESSGGSVTPVVVTEPLPSTPTARTVATTSVANDFGSNVPPLRSDTDRFE